MSAEFLTTDFIGLISSYLNRSLRQTQQSTFALYQSAKILGSCFQPGLWIRFAWIINCSWLILSSLSLVILSRNSCTLLLRASKSYCTRLKTGVRVLVSSGDSTFSTKSLSFGFSYFFKLIGFGWSYGLSRAFLGGIIIVYSMTGGIMITGGITCFLFEFRTYYC